MRVQVIQGQRETYCSRIHYLENKNFDCHGKETNHFIKISRQREMNPLAMKIFHMTVLKFRTGLLGKSVYQWKIEILQSMMNIRTLCLGKLDSPVPWSAINSSCLGTISKILLNQSRPSTNPITKIFYLILSMAIQKLLLWNPMENYRPSLYCVRRKLKYEIAAVIGQKVRANDRLS